MCEGRRKFAFCSRGCNAVSVIDVIGGKVYRDTTVGVDASAAYDNNSLMDLCRIDSVVGVVVLSYWLFGMLCSTVEASVRRTRGKLCMTETLAVYHCIVVK
jgi:hypothetical protein